MLKPLQPGSQAAGGSLSRESPGLWGWEGEGLCLETNGVPGGCV